MQSAGDWGPTLTRGVSDPAERPWGRATSARAGSLTPLPCCDTCAGALTGRQKPPPFWLEPDPRQHRLCRVGCGAAMTAVAPESQAIREIAAIAGRGPTAPWPCVSLLGPFFGVPTAGDDDGRVSASP